MSKWTKWLMGIISAVMFAVGIALCFTFTAGIGLVIGSALLAGGVSGFFAAYQGADWGDFWKSVTSGLICGAISGIASPLVANLATTFGSMMGNQLSNYLIHMAISVVGHMGISYVTNGIQNKFRGVPFNANWEQALISGAIIGCVTSAVYIIQDIGVENIINKVKTMFEEFGSSTMVTNFTNRIRGMIPNWISQITDGYVRTGLQFAWEKISSMPYSQLVTFVSKHIHVIGEFGVSAATQYIMTGEINWVIAAAQAVAYGSINRSLASRNLSRNCVRQVPPRGLVYVPQTEEPGERGNLPTGGNRDQESGESNPNIQIPPTKDPLADPTSTPTPAPPTHESAPPTYAEATRDDVPTTEPSVPTSSNTPLTSPTLTIVEDDKTQNISATTEVHSQQEVSHSAERAVEARDDFLSQEPSPLSQSATVTATEASFLNDNVERPESNKNTVADSRGQQYAHQSKSLHRETLSFGNNVLPQSSLNKHTNRETKKEPSGSSVSHKNIKKTTPIVSSVKSFKDTSNNVNDPIPILKNPESSALKTRDVVTSNVSKQPEELNICAGIGSKSEKRGDNAKIKSEKSTLKKIPIKQHVTENREEVETLLKNLSELISDEEYEIINNYENLDGKENSIDNIESELSIVDKILYEQEQNQIGESYHNSRIEVSQYNTDDYAQKVDVSVQNEKSADRKAKPNESFMTSKLNPAKANATSKFQDFSSVSANVTTKQFTQKKFAVICPLVIFNEDEAEYQLLDPKTWPKFPDGGVRVVSISGAHKSGRTTFIHSLAYALGYSLTKEQSITSRFPTGIFMYLFPQDNLLVLDCTDSITRIDDNLVPSALTLELFCYLISDHRIHHVIMENNPEVYIEHCETTMKMLYRAGGYAKLIGGKMATLLLRHFDKMPIDKADKFNKLKEKYQEQTEKKAERFQKIVVTLSQADTDGNETGKRNKLEAELGELLEDRSFDLKIEKLLMLPKAFSSSEQQAYHAEMKMIKKMILKTTPINHTFEKISPEMEKERPSFAEVVSEVWFRVAENKEIFKCTSNALNKHIANQCGDKFDVNNYFKEIQENYGDVEGVREALKWLKTTSEENAEKAEKDAMFVFRGIARIAEAVLKDRNNGDCKYFESCVHSALSGLLLFFGEGEKSFEFMSVKAAIEDTKILEELIDDAIINNFAAVWTYFYYIAYYLYRLELINIRIIEKAIKILKNKENENIKANIYATMSTLIYADVNCILGEKTPPTENKKLIDEEDLIEIHYKFEKAADKFLIQFKEGQEYKTRKDFHVAYSKMMEFPKAYLNEYFNGTVYAKYRKMTYDEIDPPIRYRFECTMLKHFYNAIGYYVSKMVIANFKIFMPPAPKFDLSSSMHKQALNLWTCIGNLSITFENLLPQILLKTNLKEWLLTYRKNLRQTNVVSTLKLCNVLIYAESIRDYIKHLEFRTGSNQKQYFDEIQLQNKREKLSEHYRHIGLDILEKTETSEAIKTFCSKNFDSSMLDEAETWIAHFEAILKQGLEKDDKQKCLFAFLDRRFKIVTKLATIAGIAEKVFNDEKNLPSPDTVSNALKLLFAISQFLNKMLVLNKVEETGDFFNPDIKRNSNEYILPVNCEIWGDLMKIFGILAKCFVKNGRHFHSKSNLDVNVYEYGLLHVLWFIYNLSTVSKIPYTAIENFYTKNITFDHIKSQKKETLIYKIEDYCALEVYNEEKKDIHVIRTGAYIWAKYAKITTESMKETFHEEYNYLICTFDDSIKLWRCSEKKNRKIEDFKKRLAASGENFEIVNKFSENLISQPVESYQDDDTMRYMRIANGQKAITDIIFTAHGHEYFEGWQFVAPNHEQKLFKSLITKYGKVKAIALMFMLSNDEIDKVQFVIKHFDRILKKPPTDDAAPYLMLRTKVNGEPNSKVQELFKLSFIFESFTEFGYQKSETEEDGIKLKATASSVDAVINKIKEFSEFSAKLNDKIGNLSFESVFVEVNELTANERGQIGIFEFLELPPLFVQNPKEHIRSYTVGSLRKSRIRNGIDLQYALIRIRLNDGKTVQAVFLAGVFLRFVSASLARYLKLDQSQINLSNMESIPLSPDQTLNSLGLIPGGYLKAFIS